MMKLVILCLSLTLLLIAPAFASEESRNKKECDGAAVESKIESERSEERAQIKSTLVSSEKRARNISRHGQSAMARSLILKD